MVLFSGLHFPSKMQTRLHFFRSEGVAPQVALEAKRAACAGRLGLDWPRAPAVRNPDRPSLRSSLQSRWETLL
eukprot:3282736-Amphidinium_carterae.1